MHVGTAGGLEGLADDPASGMIVTKDLPSQPRVSSLPAVGHP
jgi:hypothetical protein